MATKTIIRGNYARAMPCDRIGCTASTHTWYRHVGVTVKIARCEDHALTYEIISKDNGYTIQQAERDNATKHASRLASKRRRIR